MKIKNTTFIQRHAEKVALGAAGLFLLLVALYYLLGIPSKPFGITLGAAKQSAKMNISDAQDVMKQKADDLGKKLQLGKPPKNASPVDPVDYRPSNNPNDIRSLSYPDLLRRLRAVPVTANARLLLPGELPIDPKDLSQKDVPIAAYYQPLPPVAATSKSVSGNVVLAGGEDRAYVSVEASFNLEAWAATLAGGGKEDAAPLNPAMIKRATAIAGVYLEREEWDAAAKKWGNFRRIVVDGQACYLPDQAAPDSNAEPEKAHALIKSILDNQAAIQRPSFPPLDSSSPLPLLREIPKAPSSDAPSVQPIGPDTRAGKGETLQTVQLFAHDLTVESGRKYRYRLVACTLNPLYGVSEKVLNLEQSKENATRVSLAPQAARLNAAPWVEREVPATSHCFLTESSSPKKALFEIWRVVGGVWVSASFEVKVGDAIGSKQTEVKGADGTVRLVNMDAQRVLVDIQDATDPVAGVKTRTVLLMGPDGRLETHYLGRDAESPVRKELLGGDRPR